MDIRNEVQTAPVADEVSAITAVVRPILKGALYSLRKEVVAPLGGYEKVPLFMLADLRNPGDGDCGISFEYAVHDALERQEAPIVERVRDAMNRCNLPGSDVASILFGVEKSGSQSLIETAADRLTAESRLMSGLRGQPVKLRGHLASIAGAFRSPKARMKLPQSISGLWKADLFLGDTRPDRWVGTSVKINPTTLEGARGLRVGIVPSRQGQSDGIRMDDTRNLVVCPVPYDQGFMQTFYFGWETVTKFLSAHAHVPTEVNLPAPAQREVARYLESRRAFPVADVIEALADLSQPHLLKGTEEDAEVVPTRPNFAIEQTTGFIAPKPLIVK